MADQIRRYPSAFGFTLLALDFYLASPLEVVVVGPDSQTAELWRTVWDTYLPNRVILRWSQTHRPPTPPLPLLEGRTDSRSATAYVCQAYACQAPVHSAAELSLQLTSH